MNDKIRFRVLLPIAQAVSAAAFGGVGVWLRHRILDQRFLGTETLWSSTAVYHVWPWPYKVAVITNLPAFFSAAFVSLPVSMLLPSASIRTYECIDMFAMLVCVVILWYFVGRWMDRWAMATSSARCWTTLACFTALSWLGILAPGYVGYFLYAVGLWLLMLVCLLRVLRRQTPNRTNAAVVDGASR